VEKVKPAHVCGIVLVVMLASCVAPTAASVYFTSSTPQVITKGDTFSVSGNGAKNGTLALWIVGRSYFDVRTITPDKHGNFSFSLKPTETAKLTGGQFVIALQDPGPDGLMEIEPGKDGAGNLTVMNRGKIIARLGAQDDLTGDIQVITGVLTSAENIPGVDDTFLIETYFVEEPAVYFDNLVPGTGSLSASTSGNAIVITGTTNMGTENQLRAVLQDQDTGEQVTEKTIPVVSGTDINHWTWSFDTPGLQPGNYELSVGWTKTNTSGTGTASFPVVAPAPPQQPILPQVPVEVPQLPQGLGTLLVISSLFVLALVIYTVLKP
jgi:hypothetical protein